MKLFDVWIYFKIYREKNFNGDIDEMKNINY